MRERLFVPVEKLTESVPSAAEVEARRQQGGLSSIIGQKELVRRLTDFAALYSQAGSQPAHILLTGADGMGKRTVARAFAVEYCGNTIEVEVRSIVKTGDLLGRLANLRENHALVLSDIEQTSKAVAPVLAEALRQFTVDLVLDKGMFAKTVQLPLGRFVCVATASSERECARDLVEKFALAARLESYSEPELASLCERVAQKKGISITPSAAALIAGASRGTPHQIELLISRVADVTKGQVTEQDVARILSAHGLGASNAETSAPAGLSPLSGVEFEIVIGALLKRMGFHAQITKASGDGGVDIVATLERPLVGGRYLIQCKRFAPGKPVDAATVREFYGTLTADPQAVKGILVTTSYFTFQARQFARQLRIELIGGDQLQRLLAEHGMVTSSTPFLF